MSKFKIGDKVKILSTDVVNGISNHGVRVGMIGEVIDVDEVGADVDEVGTDVDEVGADVKHPNFKWGREFYDYYLELLED